MDYIKTSFSNLMGQATATTSTTQSNLFWTYSAGGVPILTYIILAGTTVVLATSTLAMSGGSEKAAAAPTESPAAAAESPAPESGEPKVGGSKRNKTTKSKKHKSNSNTKRK